MVMGRLPIRDRFCIEHAYLDPLVQYNLAIPGQSRVDNNLQPLPRR